MFRNLSTDYNITSAARINVESVMRIGSYLYLQDYQLFIFLRSHARTHQNELKL